MCVPLIFLFSVFLLCKQGGLFKRIYTCAYECMHVHLCVCRCGYAFACGQRGAGRLILHAALRLAATAASNTAVWKRLEPEGSSSRVPGRRLAGAGPEGCAPSMEVCLTPCSSLPGDPLPGHAPLSSVKAQRKQKGSLLAPGLCPN